MRKLTFAILAATTVYGSNALAGICQIHKYADYAYLNTRNFQIDMSKDACVRQASYQTLLEICVYERPTAQIASTYMIFKYWNGTGISTIARGYSAPCSNFRGSGGSTGGTGGGGGGSTGGSRY